MIKICENLLVNSWFKQTGVYHLNSFKRNFGLSTVFNVDTVPDRVLDKARRSKLGALVKGASVEAPDKKKNRQGGRMVEKYTETNRDYKFVYPDFLPNPVYYFRDKVRERLERIDMINRRKQINIPEFYVGSIMAVTVSDPYATGRANRFVGICIRRDGYGLRHTFTLRNVIDGLGVEIMYDLYNPTIQSIEVLKLEKRLDDNLTYLQDCPPEYSTVPFDFSPIKLLPGAKVPLNTIKVPLNEKKNWRHRWDRKALKGVVYPEIKRYEHEQYLKSHNDFKPFDRWDMMKTYRETVHDDDHREIIDDIKKYESEVETKREVITAAKQIVKTRAIPKEENNS